MARTLEAAAEGQAVPAVTFLCSPNNPTGGAETRENVRSVLDLVPGILAVDEAYGQFAPWSAIELADSEPRLAVVRTFSKTWAMAGLRLGYLVAHPDVVAALANVALPYHLDVFKQAAGRLALGFDKEMRARSRPRSWSGNASPGRCQTSRSRSGPPTPTSSCSA